MSDQFQSKTALVLFSGGQDSTTCLAWAVSYQVPVTAACHAYLQRITSRPAYHAGLAANTPRSTA